MFSPSPPNQPGSWRAHQARPGRPSVRPKPAAPRWIRPPPSAASPLHYQAGVQRLQARVAVLDGCTMLFSRLFGGQCCYVVAQGARSHMASHVSHPSPSSSRDMPAPRLWQGRTAVMATSIGGTFSPPLSLCLCQGHTPLKIKRKCGRLSVPGR